MTVLLGAIADDFTGATDLASTLVNQGLRTLLVIAVPGDEVVVDDSDAVIVALKSRTAPVSNAVEDSIAALRWLQALGTQQFFFKYCSTFDSTANGNIGPVADALLAELDTDLAVVCPAFPANQRSVYQGNLYVADKLLSESSMREHPLTPMRDSNLLRLMDAQSRQRSALVDWQTVRRGPAAIEAAFARVRDDGCHYAVVDAIEDADLDAIGVAVANHLLVTGGSGVARGLPKNYRNRGLLDSNDGARMPGASGRSLVLAGSCSAATRAQIEFVKPHWPHRKIDFDALANDDGLVNRLCDWAQQQNALLPVLIYSSADPDEVQAVQERHGLKNPGAQIEQALAEIACKLCAAGFGRLVIAGGETSGAVVSALGIKALRIGVEIAPGVPWTQSVGDVSLALALKSGNFGGEDFFQRAFALLQESHSHE